MIWVGEFKETHNREEYPSIFTAIREKAPDDKRKILAYLKNGKEIARAPGYLHDRINGESRLPNPACFTDGTYSWRSDLIYYYEKYNIELPKDFIEHVLKKQND